MPTLAEIIERRNKDVQKQKPIEPKPVKKIVPIKNIPKEKKEPKTAEKSIFLKDLEYILDKSGYKVIIKLNKKTPTRLKSGILQANKIKGYNRMINDELDNELSKLIANNILKTLKGADTNGK